MKKNKQKQESIQARINFLVKKQRFGSKKLAVVLASLLFVIGLIGGIIFIYISTFQLNAESRALLGVLKNTLASEQLKVDVTLNQIILQKAGPDSQGLNMSGEYKKNAGLSVTADLFTTSPTGVYLKVKSKWIVDSTDKNSTYVNLANYSTGTTNGGSFQYTPEMNKMVQRIVGNNNKSFNNKWLKFSNTMLRGTYSNTGVQGCLPKIFYETLSSSREFQSFMKDLATVLDIKKTGSSSNTDTYVVLVKSNKYEDASKRYINSNFYKNLTSCDPIAFSINEERVKKTFMNTTMTIQVDNAKKTITTIAINDKDLVDFKLTLSPASSVSISVPKASTDLFSGDILEKYPQFSYDFDHLKESSNLVQYGACYNFDKYKNIMPPEAIKICESLKNSN